MFVDWKRHFSEIGSVLYSARIYSTLVVVLLECGVGDLSIGVSVASQSMTCMTARSMTATGAKLS